MKPLGTNRQVLTWLCVCPADPTTGKLKKLVYIVCTVLTLAANVFGLVASIAFFAKFMSTDLELALHALLAICAWSSATYLLPAALVTRHKINEIFESLAKIYDADSGKDTLEFLVQANIESQSISREYLGYILIGFPISTIMMAITSVVLCWFGNGSFDADIVYHPFLLILPWDTKTFAGYICEITFSTVCGDAYLFANFSFLMLFISLCVYHQKFSDRFVYSLRKFELRNKKRNDRKLLCELIQFHNSIKEWFFHSSKVYSMFILIQLAINTLYLACIIFELDLQLRHFSSGIIIFLTSIAVGVANLFLYCFFGKLATQSYAKMADDLFEANWRTLSVNLQKYFIMMIANAQRPVFYHGFGIAVLNLETFTRLLKTVFTYYMAFKTLMKD